MRLSDIQSSHHCMWTDFAWGLRVLLCERVRSCVPMGLLPILEELPAASASSRASLRKNRRMYLRRPPPSGVPLPSGESEQPPVELPHFFLPAVTCSIGCPHTPIDAASPALAALLSLMNSRIQSDSRHFRTPPMVRAITPVGVILQDVAYIVRSAEPPGNNELRDQWRRSFQSLG